ncbi:MAG: hypothetical protein K2Z80_14435, partial [Xanthobacteraceae bacterium]|nr:hypothetical protein [Xanthobacteraceae bacterium]
IKPEPKSAALIQTLPKSQNHCDELLAECRRIPQSAATPPAAALERQENSKPSGAVALSG